MGADVKATCSSCDKEVIPGTLFCWRHPSNPPQVGEYSVDAGQLRWSSRGCRGNLERMMAVTVDGAQVELKEVLQVPDGTPTKLAMTFSRPGVSGVEPAHAEARLAGILERLIDGWESVEANVSSA